MPVFRKWRPSRFAPAARGMTAAFCLLTMPAFAAADTDKKGMPQLDPSSYSSQLFWLGVFFMLFYLFMWKVAMPRVSSIIDARQSRIANDLNHATAASGEVEALKAELDRRLAEAREEARRHLAEVAEEARSRAQDAESRLSAELAEKIEKAEASIATARQAALGTVEDIAASMVGEILPRLANVGAGDDEARAMITGLGRREAA